MAFEWDDAQENWLERLLGPQAGSFESKFRVAGAAPIIDAVAEGVRGSEF